MVYQINRGIVMKIGEFLLKYFLAANLFSIPYIFLMHEKFLDSRSKKGIFKSYCSIVVLYMLVNSIVNFILPF